MPMLLVPTNQCHSVVCVNAFQWAYQKFMLLVLCAGLSVTYPPCHTLVNYPATEEADIILFTSWA